MLTVVRRKNRGDVLTISGIVTLPDGTRKRIQRRASTDDWHLANEEASVLATRYLKEAWHGPVKGSRRLGEAIVSYLEAKDRSEGTKQRLRRIVEALRADESFDPPLSQVDQDLVTRLRDQMLRHNPAPATVLREIIVPLRAVVEHAAKKRRWCDPVSFTVPEIVEGRTAFLLPDQAERLIEHSADHLKPLVTFLIATGCRLSEAFSLDWAEDVRLEDGIAIVWADATKSGTRRNVNLPPRAVSALRGLEHRTGPVFRTPAGVPYVTSRRRGFGGQIKTGWNAAVRRADLDPELTPHDCRHTYASWHYAVHKDPLWLMVEGGWSSLKLVERYAHLVGKEHVEAINEFLGVTYA